MNVFSTYQISINKLKCKNKSLNRNEKKKKISCHKLR